jgi:hypothetical protein
MTLGETMINLSTLLKDADPVAREKALSAEDAQRMRREMVSAMPECAAARPLWRRPLTFAAAAAIVMTVITVAGHRGRSVRPFDDLSVSPATPIDGAPSGSNATRQLQFATPGGTRIIWIFDQNLRLQESLP